MTRHGGLRLDHSESAYGSGESGEIAIVPGSVDKSELVRRIESTDADEVMPPESSKLTLTDTQKQVLKRWIADGAKYETHWAFELPRSRNHRSLPTNSGIKLPSTVSCSTN